MKLSDLLKDVEIITQTADMAMEITGVCHDSRKAVAGCVFVAVSGFAVDGHDYIASAVKNGAAAVICERIPDCGVPYVLVRDARLALAIVSGNYFGRPSDKMTVIGVTGTNGKTTTTYLLKHLLEDKLGAKVGLVGTNGNMIGNEFISSDRTTPESYELQELFSRMLHEGCTHVVMEVSSHSLVLHRVAGIDFDVGIFTNLTQDHLDFHHTMEEYAGAKAELFSMCRVGCVNADDAWTRTVTAKASCRLSSYSTRDISADLYASDIKLLPQGVHFTAAAGEEKAEVSLAIPGKFSVYNALGVISAGLALGLELSDCADAMRTARGVKGRMEIAQTDGDYTMVIDYAHTPDALENALKALGRNDQRRLIALFGCGGDRDRTKRPIMGDIASKYADFVIVTSDNPRTEDPLKIIDDIRAGLTTENYIVIPDRIKAIQWAMDVHRPGDVILLAGKGHEDYQEIGHEKHHLDEREIIADYIEKRKNR